MVPSYIGVFHRELSLLLFLKNKKIVTTYMKRKPSLFNLLTFKNLSDGSDCD